jgi:hypothetical protein
MNQNCEHTFEVLVLGFLVAVDEPNCYIASVISGVVIYLNNSADGMMAYLGE